MIEKPKIIIRFIVIFPLILCFSLVCFSDLSVQPAAPPIPVPPAYFNARHTSGLTLLSIENEARRRGHVPTTEAEISAAISAGIQPRTPHLLTGFTYAARFYAAIRRLQTDCSIPLVNLPSQYDLSFDVLSTYRHIESRPNTSLYSTDALDEVAFSMINNEKLN